MKISVILGHPDKDSFNHAIANTVVETLLNNRHDVIFHDLYKENFDPVTTGQEIRKGASLERVIEEHCNEISKAEGIVIVHPNWWGQPPAILKGWVDRILRPGVAYEFKEGDSGEGVPVGLLNAKTALVFNTGDTPEERELQVFGDPLEVLWKKCIFDFCGVETFYRRMFGVIITSKLEERQKWLKEVENTVDMYFPRNFSVV
ncbi:azoreductase [Methanosarcina horonobensis HB-1 = JCM 15518]|uniref:Azoreductase n=1 Tax=Methanosarcina horonobensis HB-1 = JCM 15518 TaxID=1434110 RepID=A0A0E3SE44_9EURY|nr:NAD(P)H-dependent oxidoreductase [Methanosarcina horonobensis]AKB80399.1 azoreductase [Methanosarcina horonobensis HB-1 = JCM 15518]